MISRKIFLTAVPVFIFSAGFLFFNTANAQVRVDDFNVVQREISAAPSSLDFGLTISQQESLDCSYVPGLSGDLYWAVWYEIPGDGKISVRNGSVDLPLSPNPMNLDFREANFQPDRNAIAARIIAFKASLGCSSLPGVLSSSLANSAPILVAIGAGGPGGGPIPPPGPGQPVTFEITPPTQVRTLTDLARAVARFLLQIAIPIVIIIIIYAGLLFLTSQGNKDQIAKAKKALLYAVIGLAIILIGQGFVTLIQSILNLGR